jgi:hypothetical protein
MVIFARLLGWRARHASALLVLGLVCLVAYGVARPVQGQCTFMGTSCGACGDGQDYALSCSDEWCCQDGCSDPSMGTQVSDVYRVVQYQSEDPDNPGQYVWNYCTGGYLYSVPHSSCQCSF